MAFAPDGRLFVAQQNGQLRVLSNANPPVLLSTPFLTVPVSSSGERGLLGIAFDPNFRDQSLRLRLLHRHHARDSQPSQPVYGERHESERRAIGQRDRHSGAEQPEQRHQSQRRRHALRPRRQALHRGRRERESQQRPDARQSARQDAPHQCGRVDPQRQSVFHPGDRQQPRHLGAGLAQSVHVRVPARHAAACSSTTSARSPGRRSTTAFADRTTAGRRPKARPPWPAYARRSSRISIWSDWQHWLCDHRRRVLQPATVQFPSSFVGQYFFGDFCNGWIRVFNPGKRQRFGFCQSGSRQSSTSRSRATARSGTSSAEHRPPPARCIASGSLRIRLRRSRSTPRI